MIGGGWFWEGPGAVELFGVQHFGLGGELFVGRVGEGLVLVQDGHFSFRIFANSDWRLLQGIGGTLGLDLVNDLVVLDGEVFREHTGFFGE